MKQASDRDATGSANDALAGQCDRTHTHVVGDNKNIIPTAGSGLPLVHNSLYHHTTQHTQSSPASYGTELAWAASQTENAMSPEKGKIGGWVNGALGGWDFPISPLPGTRTAPLGRLPVFTALAGLDQQANLPATCLPGSKRALWPTQRAHGHQGAGGGNMGAEWAWGPTWRPLGLPQNPPKMRFGVLWQKQPRMTIRPNF